MIAAKFVDHIASIELLTSWSLSDAASAALSCNELTIPSYSPS